MRRLTILVFVLSGCASAGFPTIIDVKEVPTTWGAPHISRVRDLGSARLPETGSWKGEPDGVATPGELILVEGDNFGRLPTVSIGGRATAIVARTDGGGIIARVPTGVPVGDVPIVVSEPKGRAERRFPMRRFAVVVHDGLFYTLRVDKETLQPLGKPLAIAGARLVRISSDGEAAWVLASRADADYLVVVDLTAPGSPRLGAERKLAHRGALLAAAMDAPVAAVVGDGQATLVRAHNAQQPALYEPLDLPMGARAPRAIELSPDGKLLALLLPEGNRLLALDVEAPPESKVLTAIDLLPDQKLPLVRDLAFSSDGETLWIVSGDNERSLPAIQPTRLTAVRILARADEEAGSAAPPATVASARPGTPPPPPMHRGVRLLSLWRTQSVPGAAAPLAITIARGQPLASGTTIRMPPDKAAVLVTSVHDALFRLADVSLATPAGAKSAEKLWHPPQPGVMVRADINGGGGPLFSTRELMSAVDLTPDAQLVVATAARVSPVPSTGGVVLDFGVTFANIWGAQPTPVFLPLATLPPGELKPPFHLGDVRIQP